MPAKPIPVLVKHCALAIYKSGYCKGTEVERVQQAFDIAVGRLAQYKFLWKLGEKASPVNILLTAKGRRAEAEHQREADGPPKTAEWDELYTLIQEEVEELDGAGGVSQEVAPVVVSVDRVRFQQRRRRLAKAARSVARRGSRVVKRRKRR